MVIRSYVLVVGMLPGMLMRCDVFRLAVAMLLVVLRWGVLLLALAVVFGWFGVLEVQGVGATVAERVVRY